MACSVHCCNSRNIELWWSPIFHATHSLPATEIAVKRVVCYCSSRRGRVVEMEIITVITFLIADHFTHVDLKIIHFICASCIIHICTKLIFIWQPRSGIMTGRTTKRRARSFALQSQAQDSSESRSSRESQQHNTDNEDPSTDLLHEFEISQFAHRNQFKTRSR